MAAGQPQPVNTTCPPAPLDRSAKPGSHCATLGRADAPLPLHWQIHICWLGLGGWPAAHCEQTQTAKTSLDPSMLHTQHTPHSVNQVQTAKTSLVPSVLQPPPNPTQPPTKPHQTPHQAPPHFWCRHTVLRPWPAPHISCSSCGSWAACSQGCSRTRQSPPIRRSGRRRPCSRPTWPSGAQN